MARRPSEEFSEEFTIEEESGCIMGKTKGTILWAASELGYSIQVWVDNECVQEYNVGNCWHDSSGIIEPNSSDAVPITQLREWAVQTCEEFSEEFSGEFTIEEDLSIAPEDMVDAY